MLASNIGGTSARALLGENIEEGSATASQASGLTKGAERRRTMLVVRRVSRLASQARSGSTKTGRVSLGDRCRQLLHEQIEPGLSSQRRLAIADPTLRFFGESTCLSCRKRVVRSAAL